MNKSDLLQKTLVLLNQQGSALDDEMRALEQLDIIRQAVDFGQLEAARPVLEKLARERELDFLLFAQNDQVLDKKNIGNTIRALRAGYSSFSGIDDSMYLSQTRQCLGDFIAGQASLDLPSGASLQSTWRPGSLSFSLIFDTEQMGGVRFGLPRILDLLEAYRTPATFFVTGFVATVYTDLLQTLRDRGHSIGIHGRYHEYLSDLDLPTQIRQIRREKEEFERHVRVRDANFIFRMDENTVEALVACGFDYFVVFMQHTYFPFAYQKMPVQPLPIWTARGSIWMVPISVETYNRPWFAIKNMIDSALIAGRTESWPHVNILLHPFRDGSLRHIGDLERLLNYMQGTLGCRVTSIADIIEQLPEDEPSSLIYYGLDDAWCKLDNRRFWRAWWHHIPRYQQRIGNLYQALARDGRRPALCLSLPARGIVCGVYPHLPEGVTQMHVIKDDPLLFAQNTHSAPFDFTAASDDQTLMLYAFVPSSYGNDLTSAVRTLRPRFQQDYTGLLPEAALRVAYRLRRGRHIF